MISFMFLANVYCHFVEDLTQLRPQSLCVNATHGYAQQTIVRPHKKAISGWIRSVGNGERPLNESDAICRTVTANVDTRQTATGLLLWTRVRAD